MASVVAVGTAIISAVAAVGSAVVSVVAAVSSAVAAAVAAIGSAITAAVSTIVAAVTAAVGTITATVGAVVSKIVGFVSGPIAEWAGAFWTWGEKIYAGIKYIAEALHLKVLMRVHSIAYILSEDYREMIKELGHKIADLGEAIGSSRDGILNLMKGAENLVKLSGAIMGKAYDVSDVTWLKTLKGFLEDSKEKIKDMREGFVDIVDEIDAQIIKPTLNTISDLQQAKLKFLLDLGETADETIANIQEVIKWGTDVEERIDKIVSDLPEFLQKYAKPWIEEVSEEFRDFKEDIYYPFKEQANDLINTIQGNQRRQKQAIEEVVNHLLHPGDVLKNVDYLGRDERIEQENKVGEVASRPLKRENEDTENQAEPSFEYLKKIRELLERELSPPDWKIGIWKELVVPAGEQSKDANTWFVGDY